MHKGPQGEWGFSHHYQAIQLPSGLTDAGMDLSTSFLFYFLFFIFFGWVREAALPPTQRTSPAPGCGLPASSWVVLVSGTPSAGTTCSLELSLPSPAGIWFKTLLPVGGTNTAPLMPIHKGEMVSCHPGEHRLRLQGFSGWECGGCQQTEHPWNTH